MTPTSNRETLSRDLKHLGLEPGTAVLVHSSFRSLGPVEGGPATVVHALLDVVGPQGLVVFPTHTWDGLSPDRLTEIDARTTPSRVIGILPEIARQWPGALRSVHPSHSVVALGPAAAWLVAGHADCATQTGRGTPYRRLADLDGKILLLGVNHERNTTIHGVEEDLDLPGALEPAVGEARLTDLNGRVHTRHARFHTWTARRFMVVDEPLTAVGGQRIGPVGQATARLVSMPALLELLRTRLQADPTWLFDPHPSA